MKILQVVDIAYEAGGAEKSVKLIRDQLRAQGHAVKVLSTDKNAVGKAVFADVIVPHIAGCAVKRLLSHWWYPPSFRAMRRLVREFQPDVIHLHTVGEFSPSLLFAMGSTPAVLTLHGPEDFTRQLLPWHLPASDYRGGTYQPADLTLAGRLRQLYYLLIQRPMWRMGLRRLKLVIMPSKYIATAAQGDFGNIPVRQVYNGIALPAPAAPPAAEQPIVLYVGRLEAVKGVQDLVEAFVLVRASLPARLHIVGEGAQRAALEALVEQKGLRDAVVFSGWLDGAYLRQAYAEASVVAIPSVWPENLPTVAIEALALGRPLVGTTTGGIPELIDDGQTGLLVPLHRPKALGTALQNALGDPAFLRRAARASITKSHAFNEATFIAQLLTIYNEVTA